MNYSTFTSICLKVFVATVLFVAGTFCTPASSLGQNFFEILLGDPDTLDIEVDNGLSGNFFDLSGNGYTRVHAFNNLVGSEDGIDVYKIVITDSENFYIRHDGANPPSDTKAFLFDADFKAVLSNDDDPAQILGTDVHFGFRDATNHLGNVIGSPPGSFEDDDIFYLAIGASGDVARDDQGNDLFLTAVDRTDLVGPVEPPGTLASWTASGATGAYIVTLSGAKMIGYSQVAGNTFTWSGGGMTSDMTDPANWVEGAPVGGPTTDIIFNDFANQSIATQDLGLLEIRTVLVDCTESDFTLLDDSKSMICSDTYGEICLEKGINSNRFNIETPLLMEFDASLVADKGEFFIDGSNGKNGTVLGMGSADGGTGAVFRGEGRVTFNSVGSSKSSMPMDYLTTEIGLDVVFRGDNHFLPADPANIPASSINGTVFFDSSESGGITDGDIFFQNTAVIVEGGDVFTLKRTGLGRFRFTSSFVLLVNDTELFFENGIVSGGSAAFRVSGGSTLKNGGAEIRPFVWIEEMGRLAGIGSFTDNLLIDGFIDVGDLVDFDIGTIEVDGDIDMSETTVTCIELAGGEGATNHDQINAGIDAEPDQNFHIDGLLQVTLIDGFVPSNADEFFIINCNNLTGTFSECNVQPFGSFDIEYGTAPGNSFVRLFNFDSGMSNPDSFVLEAGTLAGGTIADIETSDDSYLEIDAGRVPVAGSLVSAVFDSSLTDTDPENLSVVLEANANTAGLNQQIEAFNWISGEYELIDVSSASAFVDSTTTVDIGDSISSYVDNDGSVRIRIRWFEVGPVLRFPWRVSIDQILWDTN